MNNLASVILTGDLETIKTLLVSGLHPETVVEVENCRQTTPLNYACWICTNWDYGKASRFVTLLVQHKASIETKDEYDDSPLINAVSAGNVAFVQALLNCKATATSDALYHAVARNDAKTTEMLLEAGATVDLKTIDNIAQFLSHGYECDTVCLKTYKLQISVDDDS